MNIRLQKYKINRIAGMNILNSARAAGYSENYAKKGGNRIEKLVKVGLEAAFEQAGLTDKAIVAHALLGLEANKVISAVVMNQKNRPTSLADGELFNANEKTNDFIDVPDWSARHKYFETILKLTDRLKEKALVDQSSHHTLILQIEKANDKEIEITRKAVASI